MNLLHRMKHKPISRAEAKAQGLKRYFTGKPCKWGHVSERNTSSGKCLSCHKTNMKKDRDKYPGKHKLICRKSYEKTNSDRVLRGALIADYSRIRSDDIIEYARMRKEFLDWHMTPDKVKRRKAVDNLYCKWLGRDNYLEKRRVSVTKYRDRHPERVKANRKKIYYNNHEEVKLKAREYASREYVKTRVNKTNKVSRRLPENSMRVFMQNSIRTILYSTSTTKTCGSAMLCGYNRRELTAHIESRFTDGMDWGNRSEWHIDHIKPIAQFIKEGETDPAIINALSNLQPLWAKDNLSKGAKYNA